MGFESAANEVLKKTSIVFRKPQLSLAYINELAAQADDFMSVRVWASARKKKRGRAIGFRERNVGLGGK